MTTKAVTDNDGLGSDGLRVVGSVAAILAAAGILALGVSATERGTTGNADVAAKPGKVSVVGDAKVRQWDGRTFSIDVPLRWVPVFSGTDPNVRSTQVHSWALPAAGVKASDSRLNAPDWATAKKAADARIVLEIGTAASASPTVADRNAALVKGRTLAKEPAYRFGDLGPVTLTAGGPAPGRYAWRLNMAAADNLESHYFFTTCDAGRPREAWHLVFNRRSVRATQATLQNMLASIQTTFPSALAGETGCPGN